MLDLVWLLQSQFFPASERVGYQMKRSTMESKADDVFHSRAVRALHIPIENDPDPMVHQQLARLLFLPKIVELKNKRVLEFGCGSGLNCAYLQARTEIAEIVGFDVSGESVALARKQYPEIKVFRGDACDQSLDISPGS